MDINVVAVPEDIVAKLGAPYVPGIIPAGTYEGQDEDVPTAAIVNFLVTHSGVSDETAYQMTKLLWENLPALRSAHKAANAIKIENALQGMPVPLHPGAERFYTEKGLIKQQSSLKVHRTRFGCGIDDSDHQLSYLSSRLCPRIPNPHRCRRRPVSTIQRRPVSPNLLKGACCSGLPLSSRPSRLPPQPT